MFQRGDEPLHGTGLHGGDGDVSAADADHNRLHLRRALPLDAGELHGELYGEVRLPVGCDGESHCADPDHHSTLVTQYLYHNANRLTSVNGQPYTWDNNGNLLNDGLLQYSYDQANRLKQAVQGATTITFAYNGGGDRLSQTVGAATTHYVLDPAAGLTQVLADGTNTYLYGNDRLAQSQTAMQYFGADGLGSVRQIYDASAVVVGSSRYDPFGNVMSQSGATSVFGYTGEQWDAATGLEYLRARYYSSAQGRFTTRDVWEGDPDAPMSYNAWLYVYGDPLNAVDPSGRSFSSSPIHWMIEAKYLETWGLGRNVIPEFPLPGGSKAGLQTVTSGAFGQPGFSAWKTGQPTLEIGWIDLVDVGAGQAYEIKNQKEVIDGMAELAWYIAVYNTSPEQVKIPPKLEPGTRYTLPPVWEVIGPNPEYSGAVIEANMQAPGVITYRSVLKKDLREPVPDEVWVFNPNPRSVKRKPSSVVWMPPVLEGCPANAALFRLWQLMRDEDAIPLPNVDIAEIAAQMKDPKSVIWWPLPVSSGQFGSSILIPVIP